MLLGKPKYRQPGAGSRRRFHCRLPAILFLLFFLAAPFVPAPARGQVPGRIPYVLILNSYHHGYDWTERETEGLEAKLLTKYPRLDWSVEYLDAKRFPDPGHSGLIKDFLIKKYAGVKLDLVVALDNPALDLIVADGAGLFKNVPVVFAGINHYTPKMFQGRKRITGVAEVQDNLGTLKAALALHPDCREVYVLHDYTASGRAVRRELELSLAEFQVPCRITFNPPATFAENIERLKHLPAGSIGLILAYSTDRAGNSLSLPESTRLLTSVDTVPVYAMHETRLGHGIVGGVLLNGIDHGAKAGEIALRVLAGEDPDRIPVVTTSTSRPMFDYRQLERHGLSSKKLPPGSQISHRTPSFFQKNRTLLIWDLAVFGALTLAVFVLTANIIRRRRSEKALLESETRWRAMIHSSGDPILAIDPQRIIRSVNPAFETMYGYRGEEVIGHSTAFLHADETSFTLFREIIHPIVEQEGFWRGEWNFKCQDGRVIPVELTTSYLQYPDGTKMGHLAIHRDISERKRAEEQMVQLHERLDLATRAARLGIWDWDIVRDELIWDDRMYEIYGVSRGDFSGAYETWLAGVHPDDRAACDEVSRQARYGEREYAPRFRIVWPDGTVRVIQAYGQVIWDSAGRPARMTGVNFDVTELHAAEEILTSHHKLLDGIIQSAPYILVLVDREGRVENINYAGEKFSGRPKEQLLGLLGGEVLCCFNSFDGLGCGRNAVCSGCPIRSRFEYTLRTGNPLYEQEGRLTVRNPPSGEKVYDLLISTAPVKVEGMEKVLITIVDVTERKRVETALRASERKYRLLFENLSTGFALHEIILDGAGQPVDYRFLEANPAFEQFTGLKAEALLGRTVREALPGTEPYWIETYGRVALSGNPERIENYHTGLDRYFDVQAYSPQAGQFAVIFSDITERKNAELRTRQSLKEKEVLLQEIHHRVKNNLQVISSLLSLQTRYAQDSPAFEVLRESRNRLRTMAFIHSRLYQTADLARVNWSDYLSDLAGQLFQSYKVTNGKIALQIEADAVLLDLETAVPCGLIINELVSNALKYAFPESNAGGPEEQGPQKIRIGMHPDGENLVLTVSDNGVGLPPGLDFRRTESLGLQLLVTLTEQLSGSLRRLDDPGTGFEIRFPVGR